MAGTKESPRQRMVGMMYLVLTALLALQVSSTIIEKFIALNDNMEQTVTLNTSYNINKVQNIKQSVVERGNVEREVKLAAQTEKLHQETTLLLSYMDSLKKKLIEDAGGRDEKGNLKGANEETAVEVYMLGSDLQKGKAYELKARLGDYISSVNKQFGKAYPIMAPDGIENNLYKHNPEHKNKDFAQLNFGQTPLAAALAVLSEIETKIVAIENDILVQVANEVVGKDYSAGALFPVVRASKFVPAGTPYQADVFLSAKLVGVNPAMNAGGVTIPVNSEGVGQYKFIASGGSYNEDGMIKKSWTANIKVKTPEGKDTMLLVKEDYIVVKPVVQYNSAATKLLYKNCGNKMDVLVPALGAYYNPEFNVEGAVLKKLPGQGKIMVIPQGAATVKLKVKNQGQLLEEKVFNVKLIPQPDVEVKVNNKFVDPLIGVDANSIRNVSVRIIANAEFKSTQPEDAYYEVVEWRLRVASGRNATVNEPVRNSVYSFGSSARIKSNDRILVEIIKVRRKNYLGQWEEVSMPSNPVIIPVI